MVHLYGRTLSRRDVAAHAGSLSQRTVARDQAYLATVRKALLRRRSKAES